jgi:hypothetical protein
MSTKNSTGTIVLVQAPVASTCTHTGTSTRTGSCYAKVFWKHETRFSFL